MSFSFRIVSLSSLLLLVAGPAAWSQAVPQAASKAGSQAAAQPKSQAKVQPAAKPTPYVIHAIEFQGKTPYSQAALESATGLKIGAPMTSEDLQSAAERLISTGAFGDVQATLDGPMKSISVIFKITPAEQVHMLRASFDNFVWFSQQELTSEVQKRVPLFNGFVPEGGTVQEAVQDALQQMLVAKFPTAKVESQLVAPHPGQPFRVAEYHVVFPDIRIHSLTITGAPAGYAVSTDRIIRALTGATYNDGLVGGYEEKILADYKNAGYQDAALTDLKTTIASSTPTKVEVDIATKLQAGELYRVSQITWAGSSEMSADAFAKATKLHPGDIASQQALYDSLDAIDTTYRNRGFIDVLLDSGAKLNPATHEVAYTITATPRPQYNLPDQKVTGLTPEQRREFDAAWKLTPGEIYDAGYVKSFLLNNTALQTLGKLSATYKVTQEPESGLLDLNIAFRRASTSI